MKKILSILVMVVLLFQITKTEAQNCPRPIINSISPTSGFVGSTVTITGANFDPVVSNNQVIFGSTEAEITSASFGTLSVIVPAGSTTAPISVKNGCNKITNSSVPFNTIFCYAPGTTSTYDTFDFDMNANGSYNMLSQDMDLDGKNDVISAGFFGITIALNHSTPGILNFSRFDLGQASSGIAIADFDGDGKRDLLISFQGVYLYRNISTPGVLAFDPLITVLGNVGAYQIATGDFNNDGKIDIVTQGGSTAYTVLNTSTGPGNISFSPNTTVDVIAGCTGLQAADVDGDGKTDILGTQGNLNRAITIRNITTVGDSTFVFETPEFWPSNGNFPYRCMIADFDQDGKIDLTTCNFQAPENIAIFRNNSVIGDISFEAADTFPSPVSNYRIVVGDANGDGYPDIVTKSSGVNLFSLYPNNSSGAGNISFDTRLDYSSSAGADISGMAIADFDGDFAPDIATSGLFNQGIRFHRNTSSPIDSTPPTAVCKDITVALCPSGSAIVTGSMLNNGSSDACGIDFFKINGVDTVRYTQSDLGMHTVVLTAVDNSGYMDSCVATITVVPSIIEVTGPTTICQGDSVLMTAASGDTYQWFKDNDSIIGATAQTYVALTSGSYAVAVYNNQGCSGLSASVAIEVNSNTITTIPSGNVFLCSANDTINITASTSSSYQWYYNDSLLTSETDQVIYASLPGVYRVEVIGLSGCIGVSDSIIVLEDNVAPVVLCKDISLLLDSNNQASITAADLDNGSNDACGIDSMFVSVSNFDCSDAGFNSVTLFVIDVNGNMDSCEATVTILSDDLEVITNSTNITCHGNSNGKAFVEVTGGCTPYSYSWNTSPVQTTDSVVNLSAGTYVVTVTDAGGQVVLDSVLIEEPSLLIANAGANRSVYYGYGPDSCANLNGSANGGTSPYDYFWSNGDSTASIQICTSQDSTLNLSVTDANGCIAIDTVSICAIDVRCEKGGKAIVKGQGNKVMVCHVQGNGSAKTLCVSANAVSSHLANGDLLGDCGTDTFCFASAPNNEVTSIDNPNKLELNNLTTYPNPFTNTAWVEFSLNNTDKTSIAVYDLKGKLVKDLFNANIVKNQVYKTEIDGSDWPDGIYVIRLINRNYIKNIKLVHTR